MPKIRIGEGEFTFEFDDNWFNGSHHTGSTDGWAHHGIVVTLADEIVTFDEKDPVVHIISPEGHLMRSFPVDLIDGHGMLLTEEGGEEYLWISDCGAKMHRCNNGSYKSQTKTLHGTVAKFRLDGSEVFRLGVPDLEIYVDGDFGPTQIAVDEERFGGTGDVWVADGYGQSVVLRFTKSGECIDIIDGVSGAGRFDQPHAVYIDRRRDRPELLVADRSNKRIQVFDLKGSFLHSFGEGLLVSPSGFARYRDHLLVAELDSRIAVFGPDNTLKAYIGDFDPEARLRSGWPNKEEHGEVRRAQLRPGAFNTPHGLAVDKNGTIYVSEWLVGGRLDKLTPAPLGGAA